jgi:hypothetical protein
VSKIPQLLEDAFSIIFIFHEKGFKFLDKCGKLYYVAHAPSTIVDMSFQGDSGNKNVSGVSQTPETSVQPSGSGVEILIAVR